MPARIITSEMSERIAEQREGGKTFDAIAAALGVSRGAVQQHAIEYGIECLCRQHATFDMPAAGYLRGGKIVRGWTAEEDAELLRLSGAGMGYTAISRAFGATRNTSSIRARLFTLARRTARAEETIHG